MRPPAHLQCYAVTKSLAGAGRRVAVGGDSAGGNLAASAALRCAAEEIRCGVFAAHSDWYTNMC